MRTLAVATKKNPPVGPGDDEKYTEGVKFRATFKAKLELVAKDLGKWPGQLVEEQMEAFISMEYLRVLRKRLAEAESEAKRK